MMMKEVKIKNQIWMFVLRDKSVSKELRRNKLIGFIISLNNQPFLNNLKILSMWLYSSLGD